MSTPELEALRDAFVDVLAAERRVRGREGRISGELSFSHLRLLSVLLDEDGLTAGTLAERAELSAASATQMVALLEGRGMVERRRDAGDRRLVLVLITDEGRALATARRAAFRRLWGEAMDGLSPDQTQAGVEVLRRIETFFAGAAERLDAAAEERAAAAA